MKLGLVLDECVVMWSVVFLALEFLFILVLNPISKYVGSTNWGVRIVFEYIMSFIYG